MLTSEIIILSKRGMKWTNLVFDTPPSLIEFPIGVEVTGVEDLVIGAEDFLIGVEVIVICGEAVIVLEDSLTSSGVLISPSRCHLIIVDDGLSPVVEDENMVDVHNDMVDSDAGDVGVTPDVEEFDTDIEIVLPGIFTGDNDEDAVPSTKNFCLSSFIMSMTS